MSEKQHVIISLETLRTALQYGLIGKHLSKTVREFYIFETGLTCVELKNSNTPKETLERANAILERLQTL